jgi:hypothetical protein
VGTERMVAVYRALMDIADKRKIIRTTISWRW